MSTIFFQANKIVQGSTYKSLEISVSILVFFFQQRTLNRIVSNFSRLPHLNLLLSFSIPSFWNHASKFPWPVKNWISLLKIFGPFYFRDHFRKIVSTFWLHCDAIVPLILVNLPINSLPSLHCLFLQNSQHLILLLL